MSNWEADLATMWTYSHIEVLVEFLGNLVGELTALNGLTVLSPVLRMNLPPLGQYTVV